MFEHQDKPLLPRQQFFVRLINHSLTTDGGNLFASFYALFSGLVFFSRGWNRGCPFSPPSAAPAACAGRG